MTRMGRSCWLALVALSAVACGGSHAGPHASATTPTTAAPSPVAQSPTSQSSPPSTSAAGTVIRYAAPVATGGLPLSSVSVSDLGSGTCNAGSDVITGVTVYRCFAGNLVIDPCWAASFGGSATAGSVLCLKAPWSTTAEKVEASGLVAGTTRSKEDLDVPWAVQLTDGQQCLAAQGAHSQYQGTPLNYGCPAAGGAPGIALLGTPDRGGSYWTYKSVTVSASRMAPGPTVKVAIAWFAGPPPVPACQAAQIGLVLADGGAATGHESVTILLSNKGPAPCSLYGYPGVAALDASGRQVTQAQRTLQGFMGGYPSDQTGLLTVDLAPVQSASSLVEGSDTPAGSQTSCPSYPALLVTPPDTTVSTRLAVASQVPQGFPGCTPIEVHPVVPGVSGRMQ